MTAVSTVRGDDRGAAVDPRDKLEITSYQENAPKRNAAARRKQSQTDTVSSNEKLTLLPMTFTRAHAHTVWKTYSVTYDIHTCTCAYSLENLLCYLRHPHKHTHIERERLQGITEKR